jgi:diaminopimelate epimerase
MRESEKKHIIVETRGGLLDCESPAPGKISVDMGPAKLDWREIPLKDALDTNSVELGMASLPPAVCVNVGNPHAVFFIDDIAKIDIAEIGPKLERHAMFPERANIEFAQIINENQIRMRVWERGAGITSACGTGACATLVAAVRRNLIPTRRAEIILDGGSLEIEWLRDGHVMMTGPYATSFIGLVDPKNLLMAS